VLAPIGDGGVSGVIRDLVRQVLVHARTAPPPQRDLTLLYGLALRYGDVALSGSLGSAGGGWRDPGALAALWEVPVGEVGTCLDPWRNAMTSCSAAADACIRTCRQQCCCTCSISGGVPRPAS
jgi:hypothetical protein